MPIAAMSVADSIAFLSRVAFPTWAKGILIRRPLMLAFAARLGLDGKAVIEMQRLRRRYGEGLLLIRNPVRPQALVLSPGDARDILAQAPSPYSPASDEKKAALSHFEPHSSLISTGKERAVRRAFNDAALESQRPVHSMAGRFQNVVVDEMAGPSWGPGHEPLDWPRFSSAWFRIVRRVALGDAARDDARLTDLLAQLRRRGNWAFAAPKRRAARARLHERLREHLARAEPGSLAACGHASGVAGDAEPSHQVAQWLFAFDPAGMSVFRALALLASHPDAMERARQEAASGSTDMPFLRACLTETIRLYPTTPMLLRQSDSKTRWPGGVLPAGVGFLIYTPFFHHDNERLLQAHRFAPDHWIGRDPADAAAFLPFSSGPAACPARHLVPILGAMTLAALLEHHGWRLLSTPRLDGEELPGTLNHLALRFAAT